MSSIVAAGEEVVRAGGLIVFRIINKKIEYLLLQASEKSRHWTPPKGHVEPGEDDLVAAKRETAEEAGFQPFDYDVIEDFHDVLHYQAWGKPKKVTYWPAKLKNPETPVKISEEHIDFRWAENAEAVRMVQRNDMQGTLKKCEEFLKKKFAL